MVQQVFLYHFSGDTAKAYADIVKAGRIENGKDFGEVAAAYSTDPHIKQTKGNIGYITVFTLPYSIGNPGVHLKPGGILLFIRSNAGYHIFKNAAERPALAEECTAVIIPAATRYTVKMKRRRYILQILYITFTGWRSICTHFFNVWSILIYGRAGNHRSESGDYNADFEQQFSV
jgi:hypothetical protein